MTIELMRYYRCLEEKENIKHNPKESEFLVNTNNELKYFGSSTKTNVLH